MKLFEMIRNKLKKKQKKLKKRIEKQNFEKQNYKINLIEKGEKNGKIK